MTIPPPDIEAQRRAEWEGTWTAADYLRDASEQQAEWNDAMAQEARDARDDYDLYDERDWR